MYAGSNAGLMSSITLTLQLQQFWNKLN